MKQVVFKVEDALFKKAKIKSVQSDQNMTQYLTALIEADLNKPRGNDERIEDGPGIQKPNTSLDRR